MGAGSALRASVFTQLSKGRVAICQRWQVAPQWVGGTWDQVTTPFQNHDSLQLVSLCSLRTSTRLNLTSLSSCLWPLSFWEGCGYDISHSLLAVGILEAGLEQPIVVAWQRPLSYKVKLRTDRSQGRSSPSSAPRWLCSLRQVTPLLRGPVSSSVQ